MRFRKTSRRGFLGGAAGAAAMAGTPSHAQERKARSSTPSLALEDFQPKSMLVVPEHPVARAKYPVIDVHTHVGSILPRKRAAGSPELAAALRGLDEIVAWMDRINLRTMINLTGGYGERLRQNVRDLQERHRDRFFNCVEPAYDRAREQGYAQWQAAEIERGKRDGAVGVKVLKTLGLYLRENGKDGPLVRIDDPRFDPMWEAAGQLKLPVFIHTSDPDAFFTPIDRFNERWEELGHHPDWSFYGKDYPPKAELLAARNRVIARHPKTTFVGLHVANHPENLDEVSIWLDRYPNLYVELAARLGELGREPRRARAFFDRYQDRIMFGTDATPSESGTPQQDLKPELYQIYFRWLETLDEYFDYAPSRTPPQGRWRIYGIGLPDAILKNVYHNNAARLLGWAEI
ncbi:MAG TPA: amidohydrolase family protein [Bryobacteraceae bacterium]|nr:amidohydrolase family protein [Bryobacteraceae bacterium]